MSRFSGKDRRSPLTFITYWLTRMKVGRVVKPIRLHALRPRTSLGYGLMELAQEGGKVARDLKRLVQVRVAMRVGCPF